MGKLPMLGNPGSSHQFGIRISLIHGFSYTGLSHHFGIPISLVPRIQLHRASVIHSPSFQGENAWCATYPHPRPLIAEPQFPYLRKWKNISPQDEIEQDVWEGLGA